MGRHLGSEHPPQPQAAGTADVSLLFLVKPGMGIDKPGVTLVGTSLWASPLPQHTHKRTTTHPHTHAHLLKQLPTRGSVCSVNHRAVPDLGALS